METFRFRAAIWRYSGDAGWMFVTVPADISEAIRELTDGMRRGFGSVRVAVRVGATSWQTSVFPDGRSGTFLLPVKKAVRVAEAIDEGDEAAFTLTLVVP